MQLACVVQLVYFIHEFLFNKSNHFNAKQSVMINAQMDRAPATETVDSGSIKTQNYKS